MCAGFCALSPVHAEELFFRDWDQDAEHCCHCRRCCSEQFEFDRWGAFEGKASPVIADLKSCREKNESRRKAVKDTWQRWFGAETVASLAVGETAPRTTVRTSDVVKVGDVQYVEKLGLPCCSRSASIPGRSKKKPLPVSPGVAKKQFSVESPSASCPSFETALEKSFEKSGARRSGRDRRNAPVFEGGYH